MKKVLLSFVFAFAFGASFSQSLTVSYVNGYKILKGERPEINIRDFPADAYEQGKIKIKIDRAYEMQLPDVDYQASSGGFVTTGISELDILNAQFQATSYTPLFGMLYETGSRCNDFRERHQAWGFHLWFTIEMGENVSVADAVEAYQALPFVEVAEPFYKAVLYDADEKGRWSSDDPQLGNQWHYNNTGQAGGTAGCDISLFDAWNIEKGNSDVVVAVVDCGINKNHPDLGASMWGGNAEGGFNFYNNSPTITPGDHGCHTGGTISAVTNNGVGVAGIAGGTGSGDGVRLMTCEIFPPSGSGSSGVYQAYVYSADNGACISQNSWGYNYPNMYEQSQLDGIDYFIANGGGDVMMDGIVIYSSGNSSSNALYYPGCYPPCLAVAATNNKDQKAGYSNYGTWVEISAPGGVTNYNPSNPAGVLSCLINGYAYYEGTSMACPHVSGVAALLVSYASRQGYKLSRQEVWDLLIDNVDDHYPMNPSYTGMLGSGRLNAHKALTALLELIPQGIVFESFVINDSEANDNGRLNPGETVHLTVSMRNATDQPINDVHVTFATADALVTVVNGEADYGNFAAEEIKTVENAFTITLSEDAVNQYEIAAILEAAFEATTKESPISITVYDYVIEMINVKVANESGEITPGETSDIWIYLKNTGEEPASDLTAVLSTSFPYLTINKSTEYYGELNPAQYKHRDYNVTLSSDVPEGTTEAPITFTVTEKSGRITELGAVLHFKNNGTPPQACDPVENLSATIVDSDIILTWTAPANAPEKYFVYCNDLLLGETTETTYTLTNAEIKLYHFSVEALYADGCSEVACVDIMPCDINVELTLIQEGEAFLLSWLPVLEHVTFKIFKNSEFLTEVEENEYLDSEIEVGVEYCYTVTAVCPGNLESEPSNEVCETIVSINELENDVKIYPNPTNSILHVETRLIASVQNIEILDMMGRMVETRLIASVQDGTTSLGVTSTLRLDISHLPTGIYFIRIQTENGTIMRKIVKQ